MKYPLIAQVALLAAALLAAAPLGAQEWQVARESFAFAGSRLTIRVDAEAAGTLRVIRGAPGSVAVASRAARGFTAAGLTATEELTLTSAGQGPVDYMVSVPEAVWIQVRLPGHSLGESIASRTPSRTFEWEAAVAEGRTGVAEWLPPLASGDEASFTTYAADSAPRIIELPDLAAIQSLGIRIQGDRFRVLTSRPLSVTEGSDERLQIRPAAPPMELVLVLPARTDEFRLEAGGVSALVIQGGAATALCSPVVDQRLSNGRRWFTFKPRDGALQCTDPGAPRHEG